MFNISFVFEIFWFLKVESFFLSWPIGTLQNAINISTQTLPSHGLGLMGLPGVASWGISKYPSLLYQLPDLWPTLLGLHQIANFMDYIQRLLSIISYISWVNIQQLLSGYTLTSNYYFKYKKKDGCWEPCKLHNPCLQSTRHWRAGWTG